MFSGVSCTVHSMLSPPVKQTLLLSKCFEHSVKSMFQHLFKSLRLFLFDNKRFCFVIQLKPSSLFSYYGFLILKSIHSDFPNVIKMTFGKSE